MRRKKLGARGENLARKYLTGIGYSFIDKNFSCALGEIDLIFKDGDTLVFVEVKTRKSNKFGSPETAVTSHKLKSISASSRVFKKMNRRKLPSALRIDVIAINLAQGKKSVIKHIKNVAF